MKKNLLIVFTILIGLFTITSCEEYYDERVLPITGIYEGSVVGFRGVFKFEVVAKGGDDLILEAPLDGQIWDIITIDIDDKDSRKMDVDIPLQTLEPGVTIKGDGFFLDGRLQLNYTINASGDRHNFRLVGQQW
jgi:hypothetical protein